MRRSASWPPGNMPAGSTHDEKIQVGRKRRDVIASRYATTSQSFPVARAFLEMAAMRHDAELGRAKLVRLMPGHRVHAHRDRSQYYAILDRFHLVLRSAAGRYLKSGD